MQTAACSAVVRSQADSRKSQESGAHGASPLFLPGASKLFDSQPNIEVLRKIISGGQTGADRAGLDFAIEAGLEHGGYVPRGRKAEDGRIDDRYRLVELPSGAYPARTKRNVAEGDGTVIFSLENELAGGSELTLSYAIRVGKPAVQISNAETQGAKEAFFKQVLRLRHFIEENGIKVLNVAGSRES